MKKKILIMLGLVLLAVPFMVYSANVDVPGQFNNTEFNTQAIMNSQAAGGAASNVYILPGIFSRFAWVVKQNSAATSNTIALQGSLDGSAWDTLDSAAFTSTYTMRHLADKPVKYLRANITVYNGAGVATVDVLGIK